ESAEFPSISGQHCKIIFEPPGFTLYDLSRNGTLVNDRPVIDQRRLEPGDWIRLGPDGPMLRFLGQVLDQRKLLPTACQLRRRGQARPTLCRGNHKGHLPCEPATAPRRPLACGWWTSCAAASAASSSCG